MNPFGNSSNSISSRSNPNNNFNRNVKSSITASRSVDRLVESHPDAPPPPTETKIEIEPEVESDDDDELEFQMLQEAQSKLNSKAMILEVNGDNELDEQENQNKLPLQNELKSNNQFPLPRSSHSLNPISSSKRSSNQLIRPSLSSSLLAAKQPDQQLKQPQSLQQNGLNAGEDEDDDVFNSHHFHSKPATIPPPSTVSSSNTPSASPPSVISLSSPPLDWNIYSRLRITSPQSFIWMLKRGIEEEQKAIQAALKNPYERMKREEQKSENIRQEEKLERKKRKREGEEKNEEANENDNQLKDEDAKHRYWCSEFFNSLIYYHFPSSPLPPPPPPVPTPLFQRSSSTISNLSSLNTLDSKTSPSAISLSYSNLIDLRWSEYELAFRSLYYQLRKGQCKYFYWINNQFAVLFTANSNKIKQENEENQDQDSMVNEADPPHLTAIISTSTLSLRSHLLSSSITFTQPYSRLSSLPPTSTSLPPDLITEITRIESLRPGSVQMVNNINWKIEDRTLASIIIIEGRNEVHGLWTWLETKDGEKRLKEKEERRREEIGERVSGVRAVGINEVPQLYANIPFQFGTMAQIQVSKVNQLIRVRNSSSSSSSSSSTSTSNQSRHRNNNSRISNPSNSTTTSSSSSSTSIHYSIELHGPILPLNFIKLLTLFTKTQYNEYRIKIDPYELGQVEHFISWNKINNNNNNNNNKQNLIIEEEKQNYLNNNKKLYFSSSLPYSSLIEHPTLRSLLSNSLRSLSLSHPPTVRITPVLKRVECKKRKDHESEEFDSHYECEMGQLIHLQ